MLNALLLAPILFGQYGTDSTLLGPYNPSFSDFGPLQQNFSQDGYTFAAGTKPDQFLTLGDISPTGVDQFTFGQILNNSGQGLDGLTLADFPLLANSSLEQVANATGNCNQVCQNAGTYDGFLSQPLNDGRTVGEAINQGDGQKTLAETLGVDKQLKDIKKVRDAVIGKLNQWEQEVINNIPGLSQVPLLRYPAQIANTSLAGVSLFAQADVILDKAEKGIDNTVTGSDKEKTKFNTPCIFSRQQVCGHIELQDKISVGMAGKRWINGRHQKVRGGRGILGALFGGKEPTGRLPFGPSSTFKLVLTKTDEQTDTASFSAYFRVCEFLAGCTPYAIGPFPLYSTKRDGLVWMGFNPQDFGQFPLGFDPAIIGPPNGNIGAGPQIPNIPLGPNSQKGTGTPGQCANSSGQVTYEWPSSGVVTSEFGFRGAPCAGCSSIHGGIDVGAPTGTPIIAGEGGVVTYSQWNPYGFGNTVEIKVECTGHLLLYAHNSALYVKPGQKVKRGQQIAAMGSTGLSTGPHTHFEIHTAAGRVNPRIFLVGSP